MKSHWQCPKLQHLSIATHQLISEKRQLLARNMPASLETKFHDMLKKKDELIQMKDDEINKVRDKSDFSQSCDRYNPSRGLDKWDSVCDCHK